MFEINGEPVAFVHKKWVTLRDEIGRSNHKCNISRIIVGAIIIIEHIEVTEGKEIVRDQ